MSAPLVIVGGGPAGLATARGYREAGGAGPVLMLTADDRPPYRRPPLTKELLRGELAEPDLPIVPDRWYREHAVDVRCGEAVQEVDARGRAITTASGRRLPYAECVLCTGSDPVVPPIPGADGPRVHPVRTARHGLRLAQRAVPGARAAVIGAGFIGCEAAASLALRGVEVTLLAPEELPQVERLGAEVGRVLAGWLREAGVRLALGAEVAAIDDDGDLVVRTDAGGRVRCDFAVLGAGARPCTALAESAGVALEAEGVPVDASMRTERDGVWCAGDPAFAHNPSAGRRLRVEHWGDALEQGAVAGRGLAGRRAEWSAAPGFWSTIGRRTVKHVAWGDGWDEVRIEGGPDGFTARYGRDGTLVGVLTHERDEDYERGRASVQRGEPLR
jgi:NADPH-dependent 2,4-dienoyl-CoA reductase/sulfur reductase-like enzyme